jgi:hypothetical protein
VRRAEQRQRLPQGRPSGRDVLEDDDAVPVARLHADDRPALPVVLRLLAVEGEPDLDAAPLQSASDVATASGMPL